MNDRILQYFAMLPQTKNSIFLVMFSHLQGEHSMPGLSPATKNGRPISKTKTPRSPITGSEGFC